MASKSQALKFTLKLAVCVILVAWILHTIFAGEAQNTLHLEGRNWADLTRNAFFTNNLVVGSCLDHFGLFLDLLDLKNGSGSRFYSGKWYPIWKPKIKLFHDSFPRQRYTPTLLAIN